MPLFQQSYPYQCDTETVAGQGGFRQVHSLQYTGGEIFEHKLHGASLYPKEGTVISTDDGTFQIPCTLIVNGTSVELAESFVRCPTALVPRKDGRIDEGYCLFPCPSFVFTESEYKEMLIVSTVFGLLALFGNIFMLLTDILQSSKSRNHGILSVTVTLGVLWCCIEILPALFLGNSVACDCDTELCYHNNIACSISEVSIFILQALFIALSCYMMDSYYTIVKLKPRNVRKRVYPLYAFVGFFVPALMLGLTIVRTSYDESDPAYHLNALRSSFSCYPRLSSIWEEVILLYASILICCVIIVYIVVEISRHLYDAHMKAKVKVLPRLKRLILMGVIVSCLFGLYLSVTIYYARMMSDFGEASKEWSGCSVFVNVYYHTCADVPPSSFTSCLNLHYSWRKQSEYDDGCGSRPSNAPSVTMMVLCSAAPSAVALTAPLVFGTNGLYIGFYRKKYLDWTRSRSVKTTPSGGLNQQRCAQSYVGNSELPSS